MSKKLVIVESPAKSKTIGRYLGRHNHEGKGESGKRLKALSCRLR